MPKKELIQERCRRNVCIECGNPKESDKYTRCNRCLQNSRSAYRKRVKADEIKCKRCNAIIAFTGERRSSLCPICKQDAYREKQIGVRLARWIAEKRELFNKICTRCGTEFQTPQKRKQICYNCQMDSASKAYKEWCKRNPERAREISREAKRNNRHNKAPAQRHNDLMRKYGITLEDALVLYDAQQGKCAICGNHLPPINAYNGSRQYAIDHCHRTKVVRGILCGKCNRALGFFNDDPDLLYAAIAYLEKFQQ